MLGSLKKNSLNTQRVANSDAVRAKSFWKGHLICSFGSSTSRFTAVSQESKNNHWSLFLWVIICITNRAPSFAFVYRLST